MPVKNITQLPKCINCKHLEDRTIPRYICKLNCVDRKITDTCGWNTKKYQSKFEPREMNNWEVERVEHNYPPEEVTYVVSKNGEWFANTDTMENARLIVESLVKNHV